MSDLRYYSSLQVACAARQLEWKRGAELPLSYAGNELGGECGEAQNVIKKLERERYGLAGSRDTVEHLAAELADVLICVQLIANQLGIDMDLAVQTTFNKTSTANGFLTHIDFYGTKVFD